MLNSDQIILMDKLEELWSQHPTYSFLHLLLWVEDELSQSIEYDSEHMSDADFGRFIVGLYS